MKPDSAFVRCICCVRGAYGERSCAAAGDTRDTSSGCFIGVVRPTKYAQKRNAQINEATFKDCHYPVGVTWQGPVKEGQS